MTQTEIILKRTRTILKIWSNFRSLRELSKRSKVSKATLSRFLLGRSVDVDTLIKLEKYTTKKK